MSDLPPGASPWLHDLGRWVGRWLFRPGFRVRVHHRDRIPATGPVVLVANHTTMLDGPLRAAVAVLRGGGAVGMFPEGTRGSGDVAAAQHGAAWLARTTGAVVLPVVCRGTRRPGGSGRRWRSRIDVLVGEPLAIPGGGGRAGLVAATEIVRAELAGMVRELDEIRSRA
ncbi:MAG: lysophospholipid acyltransferase family protein [Pseudonocardia sp.]